MSQSVCKLTSASAEQARWDAYVEKHHEGSFFHLSGWRNVIERVYRHKCHYLYVEKDGVICGLLPLVEQKSKLFGHTLISTPFCVYGGAIADSESILLALEEAAANLGKLLGVDYLELRYTRPRENNSNLILNCNHSTFVMEIADDEQAILQSIKKKQRARLA